ncbi:Arm DNA-binding domain-containing protein [Mediterraneibacter gnavus]|uniref:Arm DNA-binding domain-containing protein n=1 Tax=Mediterraneibacter gnavus TaxID=33038 RepID=UPI0026836856|nr:Arm DNA-binding domain-containing protein [Mediterraneibacter gnavus]
MAAYKDEQRGTWYVSFHYYDWTGKNCRKVKRGFKTKREATEWERHFRMKEAADLDMTFEEFVQAYTRDMKPKLKHNTWLTKEHILRTKLLPYFKDKKMRDIRPKDIIQWQNEQISYRDEKGKPYAPTYLKTLQSELSALFNHAVRFYELKSNPVVKAGPLGKGKAEEMLFWTKEEYLKFIEAVKDKPYSYHAFQILYWCGLRVGDDDDKIRLNQRKPSKYKGLSRFGPEKNLQRINKFMKERPTFYKKLIQMKENFRFYLRCFYCITKVVILQFNSEKQDRISS